MHFILLLPLLVHGGFIFVDNPVIRSYNLTCDDFFTMWNSATPAENVGLLSSTLLFQLRGEDLIVPYAPVEQSIYTTRWLACGSLPEEHEFVFLFQQGVFTYPMHSPPFVIQSRVYYNCEDQVLDDLSRLIEARFECSIIQFVKPA